MRIEDGPKEAKNRSRLTFKYSRIARQRPITEERFETRHRGGAEITEVFAEKPAAKNILEYIRIYIAATIDR